MRKIIGFFSGKGGVGKTTASINIGLAMHALGEKTLMIDCDFNNSNLGLNFGMYNFSSTIHDVLEKGTNLLEAVHVHSSGLRYIPGRVGFKKLNANLAKLRNVLNEHDYVTVLDGPAGVDEHTAAIVRACDEVYVMTTPDIPSITGAMRLIQLAIDANKKDLGLIINMSHGKHELEMHELERVSKAPIIGVIPFSKDVKKSLHYKMPVVKFKPHSKASIAFNEIASNIVGIEYKQPRTAALRRLFSV